MLVELGQALHASRKEQDLTLQAVAEPAKISVSYLQKLENGQVNSPSPRVLLRLSKVLNTPYRQLMILADYIDTDVDHPVSGLPAGTPLTEFDLSKNEWQAVKSFIHYLRSNRGGEGQS